MDESHVLQFPAAAAAAAANTTTTTTTTTTILSWERDTKSLKTTGNILMKFDICSIPCRRGNLT
jgi:hypothetical protein